MRTYALVTESGSVAQIWETDEDPGELYPDLVWIDITDAIPKPDSQWTYVDGIWVKPYVDPTPELYQRLRDIDVESTRHMRELLLILAGDSGSSPAKESLESLESEAAAIRAEIDSLPI